MADFYQIRQGLEIGLRINESLITWLHTPDAYDRYRERRELLNMALKAVDKIQRDLREGRKYIEPPADCDERTPKAVNLEKAEEGFRLCDSCHGAGTTMIAKMTGAGHTECTEYCPDCEGEGQVEAAALSASSTTKE